MNDDIFIEKKTELRKKAGLLRVSGVPNNQIGVKLGLRADQFFVLFKPKYRDRRKSPPPVKPKPPRKPFAGYKSIPVVFWTLHARVCSFQNKGRNEKRFKYTDVIDRFGLVPTCYLTGVLIDYSDGDTYELDHFVPLCKGGASDLANLRLCSPIANRMKGGHLHADFINICAAIVTQNSKTPNYVSI